MLPPTEILELHRQQHASVEIAATALLAWEYLITFDREVELFWGKRWTPTSVLFFINRYTAIIGQVVNAYSRVSTNVTYTRSGKFAIAYWLVAFCVIQLLLAETIVYIRVCAMYTGRKQLHKFLLAFFIFSVVGSTAILGAVGSRTKGTSQPYAGRRQCTVTTEYGFLWAFWLPILAYEATMCFLVIRKIAEYMKERSNIKNVSGGWTSDLIDVILRDSALYFVLMFLLSAGNGVLFGQKDPTLAGMLEPVTLVMLALMGSRMLMNQRAELLIRDVAVTHATTLAFGGNVRQSDDETTIEEETGDNPGHHDPGLAPDAAGSTPSSQTTSSSEPSTMV